jgi:hypothetical protein
VVAKKIRTQKAHIPAMVVQMGLGIRPVFSGDNHRPRHAVFRYQPSVYASDVDSVDGKRFG